MREDVERDYEELAQLKKQVAELTREREKLLKIAEAADRVPISYHAQWPVYSELRDALKEWKK